MPKDDLYKHVKALFRTKGAPFLDTQLDRTATVGWEGRTCLVTVDTQDGPNYFEGQYALITNRREVDTLLDRLAAHTNWKHAL